MAKLTRLGLPAAIAVAATTAACAIPSRDNAHDPVNAPDIRVRVLDYTTGQPGDECPAFVGSGLELTVASRGHCLALDASQSVDRDGRPISGPVFDWALVDEAGNVLETIPGDTEHLVLDREFRLTKPVNQVLHIRVAAKDRDGNVGAATAQLVLLNTPPVAVPGPPRTIPLGGFPSAPGAPIAVEFRGDRSSDADGDPLTYCWTDPAGTEQCTEPGDPSPVTFDVDVSAPRRHVYRMIVSDGSAESDIRFETIHVREKPTWAAGQGPIIQLDSGLWEIGVVSSAGSVALSSVTQVLGSGGTPGIVAALREFSPNASVVSAALLRRGAVLSSRAYFDATGPFVSRVVGRPDSARVWAVTPAFDGRFQPFEVVPGPGGLDITEVAPRFQSPVPFPYDFMENYLTTMDDRDRLWVASARRRGSDAASGAGMLLAVSEDETVVTLMNDPSVNFSAIDARPGYPEVWAAAYPNDGARPSAAGGLYVWDTGNDSLRIVPIGVSAAVGFTWVTPELAWLSTADNRIRLVDVELLESTGLDASTLVAAFVPGGAFDLDADADTWTVYGIGDDPETGYRAEVSVTAEGIVSAVTNISSQTTGLLVGDQGETVHPLNLRFAVSRARSATEVVTQIFIPDRRAAAVDPTTGGVLASTDSPPTLARYSESGSVLQQWTEVQDPQGATSPMPPLSEVSVAPDGRTLWAITGEVSSGNDALALLDLTTEPPTLQTLAEGPGAFSEFREIVPVAPSAGESPFAWTHWNPSTMSSSFIATFSADTLQVDPALSVTGMAVGDIAHAPDSDDACVIVRSGFPFEYRLYRVPPPSTGQAPILYESIPIETTNRAGVFSTPGPNGLCWFWAAERVSSVWTLYVRAWSGSGTLEHFGTLNLGGYEPRSLAGLTETQFWLALHDFSQTSPDLLRLVRIDGADVSSATLGTITDSAMRWEFLR